MKRTIIVITLALLMVASIFAESATKDEAAAGKSSTTTIELELAKNPKYVFGVTKGAFTADEIDADDASLTEITNETKITLSRVASGDGNVLDVTSNNEYYLSYFFYEYDKVALTMSISGNLCNKTTAYTDAEKAANEIEFTIKGSSVKDNAQDTSTATKDLDAVDLLSSDVNKLSYTINYDETNKLGEYRWATIQLTVAPVNTSTTGNNTPTLKGKAEGTYQSTITLTVQTA